MLSNHQLGNLFGKSHGNDELAERIADPRSSVRVALNDVLQSDTLEEYNIVSLTYF